MNIFTGSCINLNEIVTALRSDGEGYQTIENKLNLPLHALTSFHFTLIHTWQFCTGG